MAIKTRPSPEHNIYPNLTVSETFQEETPEIITGYEVTPHEGYVFYDINDNFTEFDPITGEERPVTYYKVLAALPLNCNFDNFPYVAVLRSEVDENYIFGVGGNDHEVMSNGEETVTE